MLGGIAPLEKGPWDTFGGGRGSKDKAPGLGKKRVDSTHRCEEDTMGP